MLETRSTSANRSYYCSGRDKLAYVKQTCRRISYLLEVVSRAVDAGGPTLQTGICALRVCNGDRAMAGRVVE